MACVYRSIYQGLVRACVFWQGWLLLESVLRRLGSVCDTLIVMADTDPELKTLLNRRDLLGRLVMAGGAVAAGVACQPGEAPPSTTGDAKPSPVAPQMVGGADARPVLPDGLDAAHFHVHNAGPLALEARRSAMGIGPLTPVSRFFVRNNLPRPSEDILVHADAWRLDVQGVADPGSVTLAVLKRMASVTVTMVLQCSGNGRAFFTHGPSGSPWATGAAACVMWTGVRVADVIASRGGPQPGSRFLTATGGEALPQDVARDLVVVERSIPLDKGLRDCLLAWELNGAPIPISHGGPLRLIVPGYFGCNNIKYVRTITAAAAESTAKIQAKGYRLRSIGEKGAPEQPSMWRMPVKSWFNGPGADGEVLPVGVHSFHGVAFSGERGVAMVEVSTDGLSWNAVPLSGSLGTDAWQTFSVPILLSEGTHTIYSRAVDTQGDQQPEGRPENERGYGHNGWRDHGLTVTVSASVSPESSLPAASSPAAPEAAPAVGERMALSEAGERGRAVFLEGMQPSCGSCHSLADAGSNGVIGPALDGMQPDAARVARAVREGVGVMPAMEGALTDAQIADVAAYVAEVTRR